MTATTTAKSSTQRKLAHLTALIDHPGTPEVEVKAAGAMRAKLVKALQAAGEEAARSYTWEPRWAGAKYNRDEWLSTVEIAALIRAELKIARALAKYKAQPGEVAIPDPVADVIAAAPAQIRFGVRVPHYGSISVKVKNIPAGWGYGMYGEDYMTGEPCEAPSPALYKLGAALKTLASQWNYDNSDSMTDHFDTRYYLNVTDEGGLGIEHMPYRYHRWAD